MKEVDHSRLRHLGLVKSAKFGGMFRGAGAALRRGAGKARMTGAGMRAGAALQHPTMVNAAAGSAEALQKAQYLASRQQAAQYLAQHGMKPVGAAERMGHAWTRFTNPIATSPRLQHFAGQFPNAARRFNQLGRPLMYATPAYFAGKGQGNIEGYSGAISAYENMPFPVHLAYGLAGPLGLRPAMTDYGIRYMQRKHMANNPWTGWMTGPAYTRILHRVQENRLS